MTSRIAIFVFVGAPLAFLAIALALTGGFRRRSRHLIIANQTSAKIDVTIDGKKVYRGLPENSTTDVDSDYRFVPAITVEATRERDGKSIYFDSFSEDRARALDDGRTVRIVIPASP